jgi:hypothetical protein
MIVERTQPRSFLLQLSISLVLVFAGAACNPVDETRPVPPSAPVEAPISTPIAEPTESPIHPPSATPTQLPTQTPTQTLTETPTATLIPTYTILRGEVLVRANCRYGPGAPYLYKYGLVPGSNLEVIGRNELGTWILVRAIGGSNPCWVKASLMDVKGDVMSVAPTYIPLPQSPYYGPLKGVSARRDGNEVTIFWSTVALRAGDETAEAPYLVEAWLCTGGQLIFTPIGVYETAVKVVDEPGCSEPSHGRVFLAEKHGYTIPVEIPWPPHGS